MAKNDVKTENISENESKIAKQIEYYFGDINLLRDKFLKQEVEKDNGWVALSVLLTFNRLKSMTTSATDIIIALRKANSELIEISDDETKIRRNAAKPLPEMTEEYKRSLNQRTVHLKGFPADVAYEDIHAFCSQYGELDSVEMRRTKEKQFKGCIFAVYKTVADAEKAVASDIKFKDEKELLRENKVRYFERKSEYLAKRKSKKVDNKNGEKGEGDNKAEESNPVLMEKAVLKLKNIPSNIGFEKLKSKLNEYENVQYVDIEKAATEAFARFGNENGAENVINKIKENGAKQDDNGNYAIEIDGNQVSVELVTGEEEVAYWKKFAKQRSERYQKKSNHKRSNKNPKRGKYHHRGQKRSAEGDGESYRKQIKTEEN